MLSSSPRKTRGFLIPSVLFKRSRGKRRARISRGTHGSSLCGRPPRLGGASNLVENQINLAAGRRTLSRLSLPPLHGLAPSRLQPASLSSSLVPRRHEQIEGTGLEGGEGGGAEVLHATDTDLEARREGGAATKSFRLLAAIRRPGPYLSRSSRFHPLVPRAPPITSSIYIYSNNLVYDRERERESYGRVVDNEGKER